MRWFLYVVKCADDTLYTGITTDIDRRVHEHNNTDKGAKYTRSRRPVMPMYLSSFENRSTATKEELKFKKLTRKEKLEKINTWMLSAQRVK